VICRSNNIHYLRYKIVIKTSIGDYTELDSLIVLQLFDPVDYYTRRIIEIYALWEKIIDVEA